MNRKRRGFCLWAVGLLALYGQLNAAANVARIEDTPAATLLLPYFEVDPVPGNITTLFSINNASPRARLAHVTVWSTWAIPVANFDVYLTGYDVQTFNLWDVFYQGLLPQTGRGTTAANHPGSPLGDFSLPEDVPFPNCNTTSSTPLPPVYPIPALDVLRQAHLQALLSGKKSPSDNTCAGTNYGDDILRGYITVDDANSCSLHFPGETGYFVSGGRGIAGNDNVLWGDYFYIDPANNFAQGESLVHIEADAATYGTPGEYTFYGRYVAGTAADNREPLATTFAMRYLSGGVFSGGTSLIVWRDSKFPPGASCTTGPNFGELFERQIVAFDELENPLSMEPVDPSGQPRRFGHCTFCDAAQRVEVGCPGICTNADFGWFYLNLNHATTRDSALGPGYVHIAQAWVTDVVDAEGRFSVGFDAVQIDNANTAVSGGVVLE